MGRSLKIFTATLFILSIQAPVRSFAGVLKSLDEELSSVVTKTDPYLVTVKGENGWKNLIATGILCEKSGYIMTSSIIYDADNHQVMFSDGKSYAAEKVGVDHQTGLAVLKVDRDDWQTPPCGKTDDLKPGSWIMVVGNSYRTRSTVNFGRFNGITTEDFLRLNVEVSPGASGSAVLNTDGKIVGIIIAREAVPDIGKDDMTGNPAGSADALSLFDSKDSSRSHSAIAVPIDVAESVVDDLIENGSVRRGFLGISQKFLAPNELIGLQIDHGIMVADIAEDSPASESGIQKGDIITEVDSKKISNPSDLYRSIRSRKPGDKVEIAVSRGGEEKKIDVVLAEAPNDMLFGRWKLQEFYPKLDVGGKFELPDKADLERKLKALEQEILRLKRELAEMGQ